MIDIYSFSRGISVGILLLLCFKIWLDYWPLIAGRLMFALFVGLQTYLISPLLSPELLLFDYVRGFLTVLSTSTIPVFWLLCASVFSDWDKNKISISRIQVGFIGLFLTIELSADWLQIKALQDNISLYELAANVSFYGSYFMRFGFLVLAFSTMLSQWSQDLVENRRNLRTIMIGIGAIQITLVSSVELWFGGSSSTPMWFEIFNSLMLMLIFFSIGSWFLVIQPNGVFNTLGVQGQEIKAAQLTQAQDPLTSTERAWVVALKKIMTIEQVYHQSELSIGGLANQLFIPEHQLRRLINKHLGYRNFNDYLNKHRLDDASKRLMDPQNERLPILSIALDVGYGSIAPFNRAFKQRFRQTPSEYRSALQG